MLSKAGDQVPVIPLLEVVGSGVKVAPEQIGPTAVNVGVMLALTTIVMVAVFAHWPAVGVKVYVVVAVLLRAGDQVPVIPLLDVVGKEAIVAPEQTDATAVNVGVICVVITISIVVVVPQGSVGVNV